MLGVKTCVLLLGLTTAVLSVGRWILTWQQNAGSFLPDIWTAMLLVIAVILLDMYRLRPASSHTAISIFPHYIFQKGIVLLATVASRKFYKQCTKCKVTQEHLLLDILKQNKDTIFFKDFGLNKLTSVDDFRQRMSLTTYNDYRKYVNMVTETGSENVLFPGKAFYVALTSGTTSGKSKAFPKSPKVKNTFMKLLMIVQAVSIKLGLSKLTKMAFMKVCAKDQKCNSGIDCGPITKLMGSDIPFTTVNLQNIYGEHECLYIQLVFALREDDIAYFAATVSPTALTVFRIMEDKWADICHDIETGQLSTELDIPATERQRLNKLLKPYPQRARFLRGIFAEGMKNIVRRVWPKCNCLVALKTGVFETSGKIIEDKYLGDLPCVSMIHTGTETMYGVNINPLGENVAFVPYINVNFYEFIPEDEVDSENPTAFMAHQVEVGKTYEMVITTDQGLCRYRTEDIVKITEFFHTTPMYQFVRRSGDILSVETDKVPVCLLHDAIKEAAKQWSDKIVDFSTCESIHVNRLTGSNDDFKHYVVLIETETTNKLTNKESLMIDEGLSRRHDVYAAMRRNNKLQQLQLIQLKPGTFEKLKQKMLEINPSAHCMQVKIPSILRRENHLQFVLDHKL